ncbi:MAG: CHASE2 domain-containing protein [Pikeienuella sp.]|uniref:CHASE2 domain-containing protein n=1 Tax=Pikeienuella sp. TaxID=2831957 RepID=UPI003919381B
MRRERFRLFGIAAALLSAALCFGAFRFVAPLAAAEERARDLVHALSREPASTREDIVLIVIEETTLSAFPYRSPIDRGFLADLIASLAALKPAAIGLDLLIDQPTEPEKDLALIEAITAGEGPPVVVVVADEADGLNAKQADWLAAATAEAQVAQATLLQDAFTGVSRAAPPPREIRGREAPSLAVALARAAGREDVAETGFEIDFTPVAGGGEFAPRLVAAFHQYYTAAQVEGRVALIHVGLDAVDRHSTPLEIVAGDGDRPGGEVHAQALAQLLDGRRLELAGIGAEAAMTLAAALLAVGAVLAPLSVIGRAGLVAALLALTAAAPAAALTQASVRAPVLPPLAAGALAAGAVGLARWRRDSETRRRLREAFGRFVSPEIVRRIEAEPGALRLGGERRVVTCVFTDVAGFTSICEGMAPEALSDMLNRYLGGASRIFIEHGGTLDKFVGDAVVGFFNAPVDQPDHAARAIRMAVALDRFAEDFVAAEAASGRPFGITRIGVHTGEATVGNFGGELFFDYTAMGDTVNLAARLEGANKAFGGRLCISGATLAAAGSDVRGVRFRPIGALRVKGRAEPQETAEAFAEDDPRALSLPDYLAAFEAMAAGAPEAASRFAALQAAAPQDGLVRFHMARLADGETGRVITLKEK